MNEEHSQAYNLGYDAGMAAASWVFDGNTTDETYQRVLTGINDGDPAVMDMFNVPSLSGEFAGETTPRSLADELGIDDEFDVDTACEDWEYGVSDGFWSAVASMARHHLEG